MISFPELLQQGATNAWLFVPSAIALGALHGLEPGHSKTMMAAFIVAIRGTVGQAALLGLSATVSHTAIVWIVALAGLHFGKQFGGEATEGWFQLVSAVVILGVAAWMLWRTWREHRAELAHAGSHGHDHGEVQRVDTGHGETVLLQVTSGPPPRFRLHFERRGRLVAAPDPASVTLETTRPDGSRHVFAFVAHDAGGLESTDSVPEPHEFVARLVLDHGGHAHDYDVEFIEHGHSHALPEYRGLDLAAPGYQDAHELAHANDIRQRFANRNVTTGQIVLFGLTGGLVPCPASITVLLLCLQLKQYTLGIALVLCFSIGLALTMVTAGAVAALSVRVASGRFSGFGTLARRAPYVSSVIIFAIGLYTGWLGWQGIAGA